MTFDQQQHLEVLRDWKELHPERPLAQELEARLKELEALEQREKEQKAAAEET